MSREANVLYVARETNWLALLGGEWMGISAGADTTSLNGSHMLVSLLAATTLAFW